MHSEPKSNHLFGADHISMIDCQLLETKYTLLHLRVLIHPANFFFQVKKTHQTYSWVILTKTSRRIKMWANCWRWKLICNHCTITPATLTFQLSCVSHTDTISEITISKQPMNAIPQTPLVVVQLALHWYPESHLQAKSGSSLPQSTHTFTRTRLPPQKGSHQKCHQRRYTKDMRKPDSHLRDEYLRHRETKICKHHLQTLLAFFKAEINSSN